MARLDTLDFDSNLRSRRCKFQRSAEESSCHVCSLNRTPAKLSLELVGLHAGSMIDLDQLQK